MRPNRDQRQVRRGPPLPSPDAARLECRIRSEQRMEERCFADEDASTPGLRPKRGRNRRFIAQTSQRMEQRIFSPEQRRQDHAPPRPIGANRERLRLAAGRAALARRLHRGADGLPGRPPRRPGRFDLPGAGLGEASPAALEPRFDEPDRLGAGPAGLLVLLAHACLRPILWMRARAIGDGGPPPYVNQRRRALQHRGPRAVGSRICEPDGARLAAQPGIAAQETAK